MPMGEDPRHGLLVALVVALVGVLLLIFAAVTVAPALVIVLGLMTYVVWWYVSREDTSFMHHAQVCCYCFLALLVAFLRLRVRGTPVFREGGLRVGVGVRFCVRERRLRLSHLLTEYSQVRWLL